jgi:hypothetical protein
MADPVIDYSLMTPIMQPIQGFSIDWNTMGNMINAGMKDLGSPPGFEKEYPTLDSLVSTNPELAKYNTALSYYGSSPTQNIGMLSGINQYIGSALGGGLINKLPYQSDASYVDANDMYNKITGGNADFWKTNTDLSTMQNMDMYMQDMARARMDYTNAVLNGGVLDPSMAADNQDKINTYGSAATPVGIYNGHTVYSMFGPRPTQGDFYRLSDNGGIIHVPEVEDDSFFGGGLGGSLLSLATGGVSDLVQGNSMGSGTLDLIDKVAPGTFVGQVLPSLLMPAEAANRDTAAIWSGDGSTIDKISNTFDNLADPTNSVNYSLEGAGEQLPEDVRAAAPGVLGAIGTVIYPVAGSALGYGIGAHLAGQSSTDALTGAGAAALASYGAQGISPVVSNAVGGGVTGGVAGGAAQGAVAGGLGGVKPAIETGSWDPVLYGAGIGGLAGGITGGINAYGADEAAARAAAEQYYIDRYLQQNPSPYYDTITGQIVHPTALSYDEFLAKAYQAANPSFEPFRVDPTLQYVTPADITFKEILENSNLLGTKSPEELAEKFYIDRYLQQNPSPYYDTITQQIVYPSGLTPDEILVQDYMKANPTPSVQELASPPSIWDTIQDYAAKAGDFVLDNSGTLLKLAGMLSGGAAAVPAGATVFPGGGRPGMASPDAVTEFLMQHGGTGKGKSKGLGAGEVKGPYYGDSFMPGLKEIKKYDEQGLYYT